MIEYAKLLEYYSDNSEEVFHMKNTGREKDININKAKEYLYKYFLSNREYNSIWKYIQQDIFNNSNRLKNIFKSNYEFIIQRGGILFEKDDFEKIQTCMLKLGVKYLLVIEDNTYSHSYNLPMLKFKFPSDIGWEEINNGSFISVALLEMPKKSYFVFSESGYWGKYSANDKFNPIELIGYKSKYRELFREIFPFSLEEQKEIEDWL